MGIFTELEDLIQQPETATALARRLLAVRAEKERLQDELKAVSAEYDAIEGNLIGQMAASGVGSFTMQPEGVTISITHRLWARPLPGADDDEKQRNRGAVAQALTEHGLDFLMKSDFDIRSLSTFIRETQERGEVVPEGLLAVLQVVQEPTIRITGRGRKA